jgi:hypothetical protein
MALLHGLLFLRRDNDQVGVMDINGALFLMMLNFSVTSMYAVLNVSLYQYNAKFNPDQSKYFEWTCTETVFKLSTAMHHFQGNFQYMNLVKSE